MVGDRTDSLQRPAFTAVQRLQDSSLVSNLGAGFAAGE